MRVGITRNLPLDAEKMLVPYFDSVSSFEKGRPLNEAELCTAIQDKDVFICQLTEPITPRVLSYANSLKHLVTFSTGVDHLNLEALRKAKIRVSHTPGVLTEATANLAWALILNCARKISPAEAFLKAGHFNGFSPSLFLGLPLERSTLGIIGLGKIGMAVAERGKAFGMNVVYSSRTPKDIPWAQSLELEDLFSVSDVVSIHCPLTENTRHLVNARTLQLMKPEAILVNTARGPIIDELALIKHLSAFPQFSAGLDVFEWEPKITDGLMRLSNALCVPHIGSASRWAREQMARICIEEAMRFASGKNLQYEYPL